METAGTYHRPVLLEESLKLLNIHEGGTYVDATFGGGGHSSGILRAMSAGRLYSLDRDLDALDNALSDDRFELVRTDFKFIETALRSRGVEAVDGILADLGISSHQVDEPGRGFSYRFDTRLDMRMDQEEEFSAWELINGYSEQDLSAVFWKYGELPQSRKLAAALARYRKSASIQTTGELVALASPFFPAKQRVKLLSMLFQAIRIEVNGEMESLEGLLTGALKLLKPGGMLVIISYHSLEDRMVKNFFRYGNLEMEDRRDFYGNSLSPWEIVTRKAIQPDENEIQANIRARSARLRAARKR